MTIEQLIKALGAFDKKTEVYRERSPGFPPQLIDYIETVEGPKFHRPIIVLK